MLRRIVCTIGIMIAPTVFAQTPFSPVGKWITLDYATHQSTGLVEITQEEKSLQGKVLAGYGLDPIVYCDACSGKLKHAKVIGITLLTGFTFKGDNTWSRGVILNPHDGKYYQASLKLTEGGNKIQLRGYWGPFYRTETWIRDNII